MRLSEIARRLGCEQVGTGDPEIDRVTGIEEAGPGDLTFVANRKYLRHLKDTRASAVILGTDIPPVPIPSLRTANPYLAFARALEIFFAPAAPPPGIHPAAVVSPDAQIGPNPSIGACAVIGSGCRIGANAVIHPHVVIYPEVLIGDDVLLHAHVVVRERCHIGHRVVVQNGAVIGSDGFGFAPTENGSYYKIVQTGRVIIEDDVEIGANTTIDRAAVGDSIVRRGAKLDNLVQIGHASQVGENCVVAAQVGIAGSTRVGRNVQLGGQVGLAGHMHVGDNAVLTAQSGASHDIPAGAVMSGSPVIDNAVWLRCVAAYARLPELVRRIRDLENELKRMRGSK